MTRVTWAISLLVVVTVQSAAAILFSFRTGFQDRTWLVSLPVILLGLMSGIGLLRGHYWVGTAFFWWVIVSLVLGILVNLPAILMLVSLCAGLVFWDLARFEQRVLSRIDRAQVSLLERRHLSYLFIALSVGFLVGIFAILVKFELNFALELILALAFLLGIAQLVRTLR